MLKVRLDLAAAGAVAVAVGGAPPTPVSKLFDATSEGRIGEAAAVWVARD